jgi:hypothetical protein
LGTIDDDLVDVSWRKGDFLFLFFLPQHVLRKPNVEFFTWGGWNCCRLIDTNVHIGSEISRHIHPRRKASDNRGTRGFGSSSHRVSLHDHFVSTCPRAFAALCTLLGCW